MFLGVIVILGLAAMVSSQDHQITAMKAKRMRNLENTTLSEDYVLETSVVSRAKCGVRCANHAGCKAFIYYRNSSSRYCWGHSTVPVAASSQYPAPGSEIWAFDYCDTLDRDGWTRREDGTVDFYQPWAAYVNGFGNPSGEFWLGLETLHVMTSTGNWLLRVDLGDWEGNTACATYTGFYITDSADNYRLMFDSGSYRGTAGDDLSFHHNRVFSTYDQDASGFCANAFHGAWWFKSCFSAHLNGEYKNSSSTTFWNGIKWSSWKGADYSLKFTEMKIKRL